MGKLVPEDTTCPRPPSWLEAGLDPSLALICYTVLVTMSEAVGPGQFLPYPAVPHLLFQPRAALPQLRHLSEAK